jgi:hypothetical protein
MLPKHWPFADVAIRFVKSEDCLRIARATQARPTEGSYPSRWCQYHFDAGTDTVGTQALPSGNHRACVPESAFAYAVNLIRSR